MSEGFVIYATNSTVALVKCEFVCLNCRVKWRVEAPVDSFGGFASLWATRHIDCRKSEV